MTRKLVVAPAAREDLSWWRRTNPKRLEHIRRMLGSVFADPFGGIGKPEPLRGVSNTWSRRIDQRHRLVYRVYDDRIEIVAARYHYGQQRSSRFSVRSVQFGTGQESSAPASGI